MLLLCYRIIACYWLAVGSWWTLRQVNVYLTPGSVRIPPVDQATYVTRPAWITGALLVVLVGGRVLYLVRKPALRRFGTARWNRAFEAAGLIKDPTTKGAPAAPRARMAGRIRTDADGATRVLLKLPPGLVVSQLVSRREQIAASLDVPTARLSITAHNGKAHMASLVVYAEPPDLSKSRKPTWVGAPTDAGGPLVLGRDKRTGRDVIVATEGNGADLAGGKNGSGKTVLLRLFFLHFALDPTALIWGGDGKGDPKDWGPVRHRAQRWVDINDEDAADKYLRMLRDLHREVNRRYAVGGDHPWLLCLLEEATNLRDMLDDADQVKRADKELRQIVMKCRAAKVVVVLAGQHPSAELMPTAIREQAGIRVCMHMPTPRAAEFVLGYQPALEDLPTKEQRGHALMLLDGEPTKLVVDYLDDETWTRVAGGLPAAEPWRDLTLQLVPAIVEEEPHDAEEPQDAPTDPRIVAMEVALRAAGRRLSTGELWNALPVELRTANPSTLGKALAAAGVEAAQGRNGKLWALELLPHFVPQLVPQPRQEQSSAEGE